MLCANEIHIYFHLTTYSVNGLNFSKNIFAYLIKNLIPLNFLASEKRRIKWIKRERDR